MLNLLRKVYMSTKAAEYMAERAVLIHWCDGAD